MDSIVTNIKENKDRSSNIEILRIISMFLIVLHHYSIHGGFNLSESPFIVNNILIQVLSLGGKLGINLFVIITGYFMIDSNFKMKKLVKLIMEIQFYSIVSMIIFYGFGLAEFSVKELIKSLLPIIYGTYWFATTYVIMYILIPFINKFVKNLTNKSHLKIIGILIVLWSIIPTFTGASFDYSNIGWFITLYIIGAYIKLYPNKYFSNCKTNMVISIIVYGLIMLSVILFAIIGMKISIFKANSTYFSGINKLPILICAITLFLGFKNLKVRDNKFINRVAMSTFGVYLIHENYFVRSFIWEKVFNNNSYLGSKYLIFHAIITVIIVFCASIIIDQLRIILFEKPIFALIDKKENAISLCWQKIKNKIIQVFEKITQSDL